MKKTGIVSLLALIVGLMALPMEVDAQSGYIRSKIRQNIKRDMEKKHVESQREKGRQAIRDNTYENDKRYPVPENPVQATFSIQTKSFKNNGNLKSTITTKMVFGLTGECMIMNEGEKDETRMLFDYKQAATYTLNPKEKTAMKMPMMNFKKMAERMSQNQPAMGDSGKWEKTSEQKNINGYNCQKYVYTDDKGNHMDVWVTRDISIDLSQNHLFGGNVKNFAANSEQTANPNAPEGLMIQNIYYEKGAANPSTQMDLKSFKKSYDPAYFDLSSYKVTDILDKL